MKALDYIKSRQINWALNRGLILQGSKGERGEKAYTVTLEENLFEPLLSEVKEQFEKGRGGELNGYPCPMQAVHSSAALVVNVFQYWLKIGDFSPVLKALGFPSAKCKKCEFEKKFSVCRGTPPHIDVVFHCEDKIIAIESKFTEPYSSWQIKEEMQSAYFENNPSIWKEIPSVRKLAERIRNKEQLDTSHIHVSQVIKHILGLISYTGNKEDFYLIYLWYNVPCSEGCVVEREIEQITKIFAEDKINFKTITYQEFIYRLSELCRKSHEEDVRYITARYL